MIENAKWIWPDIKCDVNQYADFVLEFETNCALGKAFAEICADREYVVWVNGSFAGCGQYHDFPSKKCFDTIDIAEFLHRGKNRLCITAYYQGEASLQYAKSINGLCFAVCAGERCYLSDESVLSAQSLVYKSGQMYKTTNQLGFGYFCDFRNYDNWINPDIPIPLRFAKSACKAFDTKFMPRPVQKLIISEPIPVHVIAQGYMRDNIDEKIPAVRMQHAFLSHRPRSELINGDICLPGKMSFGKKACGYYVIIDMGQETCGYLKVDVTSEPGTVIDIGYGEHLDDLRVRTSIDGRCFADSIVCGPGRTTFVHWFRRVAGRYIQLHIHTDGKTAIHYVGIIPASYPLKERGVFKSDNMLHNRIYRTCVRTLKLCMHEHYEDCPWREQALYAADSRNQMLAGYYVFGNYAFARQSLSLLGDSFGDDGFQSMCAPTDEKLKIPSFTFIWFLAVKEYIEFSGDISFVRDYIDEIESAVKCYTTDITDGLAVPPEGEEYWNFYEWSEGHVGVEKFRKNLNFCDGLYNMFLYLALKSALAIARQLGENRFVSRYSPFAESIKESVNRVFWDNERKLYAAYTVDGKRLQYGELAQAIAVYTGIADCEKSSVLRKTLSGNNGLTKITLSYCIYKYEALLSAGGEYDEFVADDIAKRWGNMLYRGATTFWETDGGADDFGLAGSMCHGWSGFPAYIYYRYGLGITPEYINKKAGAVLDKRHVFGECHGSVQTNGDIDNENDYYK